jgi:hypothetical protein
VWVEREVCNVRRKKERKKEKSIHYYYFLDSNIWSVCPSTSSKMEFALGIISVLSMVTTGGLTRLGPNTIAKFDTCNASKDKHKIKINKIYIKRRKKRRKKRKRKQGIFDGDHWWFDQVGPEHNR